MDNIAQRLGLVMHWAGLIITSLFLIFSIVENLRNIENKLKLEVVPFKDCLQDVTPYSPEKDGDCLRTEVCELCFFDMDKYEYRKRISYSPDYGQFFDELIFDTILKYYFLTISFLIGWLIRYILVGKIHILPWK